MIRKRFILSLSLCLATAALAGCANKKKPQVIAASQPPVVAPQPTPEPTPEQPPPADQSAQPPSQGTPPPAQAQATPEDSTGKNTKTKSRNGPRKTTETAHNVPPRIVVRQDTAQPSPTPGQISPSLSTQQASQDQTTTEQLLQRTESNLNNIKRQLTPEEQATAAQIKDFMKQSREATRQNDLARARNLAVKAQLLCDALVNQR